MRDYAGEGEVRGERLRMRRGERWEITQEEER